jgi:hypothetical protein
MEKGVGRLFVCWDGSLGDGMKLDDFAKKCG